jgi:hypothetical protein
MKSQMKSAVTIVLYDGYPSNDASLSTTSFSLCCSLNSHQVASQTSNNEQSPATTNADVVNSSTWLYGMASPVQTHYNQKANEQMLLEKLVKNTVVSTLSVTVSNTRMVVINNRE